MPRRYRLAISKRVKPERDWSGRIAENNDHFEIALLLIEVDRFADKIVNLSGDGKWPVSRRV